MYAGDNCAWLLLFTLCECACSSVLSCVDDVSNARGSS